MSTAAVGSWTVCCTSPRCLWKGTVQDLTVKAKRAHCPKCEAEIEVNWAKNGHLHDYLFGRKK